MNIKGIANGDVLRNIFSSLRSRNYRIYFFGQGISLIGTWMQNIAMSWLVYRLTGSVFLLGLIGFTSQIPTFILSPLAGVISDRHSRLKLMTLTQILFMLYALTMTILVLSNVIQVWHIIALSVVFGIISAFDAPARQSLVIELIDKPEDLGNAIALNSAIFNSARLIGPAIAGITIAIVGEGICFLFNTVSFLAVIASLMQIKIPPREVHGAHVPFKESFSEGFHYTFNSVPIRILITMLAILSLFGFAFIVLLPAYAKDILNGGSDTLGYLTSAMGAGALTAALYMASRKTVIGLSRIISMSVSLLGLSVILISFSDMMLFSLIMFYFGGLGMVLSLSSINTLLQTLADEDKRGRVMSFYAMSLMGITPIGNLLAGSVANWVGIPYTVLGGGLIALLAGIWFGLNRHSFNEYVDPIYIKKGILPGISDDLT